MLGRRLVSAAVIITVMLALIAVDFYLGRDDVVGRSGLVLCSLAIFVAAMFASEMVSLFRQRCANLTTIPNVVISVLSVAICSTPVLWRDYPVDCSIGVFGWSMIALTFSVGMTLLINIVRYTESNDASSVAAFAVLIHVQAVLLFGFLIAHRLMFFDNSVGMVSLITLITTVKMSDAAAYFAGKTLGKRKLAPSLSPGKTVEGLLGSFLGAALGTAIVVLIVAPYVFKEQLNIDVWWMVVYPVAITIAGVVGDLAESMFKRDAKIKDSSSWLPGLGGVLDITDSLVYAAPISYFLWVLTK